MQVEEVHVDICIQCKERLGVKRIVCSCGSLVCEGCITLHLPSHENHERQKSWITTTTAKIERRWNWICGKIQSLTDSTSRTTQFQNDQATKWFGIHVEEGEGESGRVTQLVETPRFSCLAELSMYHKGKSPRRQFPSITSFVGETGAGKSTLIRSLIFQVAGSDFDKLEAPVPGAHSGDAICIPTTGEVNLYPDPQTFGTSAPQFLVDCEGMLGGEPDAAQHQKEWINHGRRYRLAPKGGKAIDRCTAVMSIYPRFLYLFSDVICMVTRNHKTWADSAVKLLEWSRVGAHHTVNQFALPALIIILNGPVIENEAWVSSDRDAATRDFFTSVEREINTNEVLREMAKKHGDKTMRDLLYRNFSSVYVHYIPLEGYKTLGNSGVIMLQIERLSQRIRKDTERVQRERANTRTRFDARELGSVFDYAFKHLASGSDEPFDMSQCQQQMSLPTTVEGHFAEFLGRCMLNHVEDNFDVAAEVLGSCIVRHSLKSRGSEFREVCRRALNQFLDNSQPCAYVHPETGEACVNVRAGHAKGHQAGGGHVLAEGNYVDGLIDADRFLGLIGSSIDKVLKRIDKNSDSDMEARRLLAATLHRNNLMSFPNRSFWEASFTLGWIDAFNKRFGHISGARLTVRASVCYACLFGRPEYTLPCGHVICFDCIREFDQSSPDNRYPGIAVHQDCVLCGSTDEREGKWPYRVEYRPDLSGVRVLSLDGGGVRGIIPLTILQRLEDLVNLDGPFGELFDLIVGTSAGGIIALGLGVHNFSTERCTKNFWSLCMNGFTPRPGTKNAWFGWIARLFASSIYETERLELCLRDAFGPKKLFGHCGNTSRVAVTTTVDSECRLLANYNWGNGKRYLNSNIYTWHAARCTSAAPMYFEPSLHDGTQCRDGGLMVNNPVQLAVNEAKSIWGREIVFDLIATLGCGQAENPQPRPDSIRILPSWLLSLFTIFTATMNGNAGWQKFSENVDKPLLDRCSRLNVKFPGDAEPELDDTSKTLDLEILAKSAKFHYNPPGGPFSPTLGAVSQDSLKVLADRLRASLFFFELRSLIRHDDVFIVEGWVCCRLSPERKSYESLLAATSHFRVKGQTIKIPPSRKGARLKVDVSFQQQALEDSEPIRIDAQIQGGSLATISGFPMTLKMLTTYWETKYF